MSGLRERALDLVSWVATLVALSGVVGTLPGPAPVRALGVLLVPTLAIAWAWRPPRGTPDALEIALLRASTHGMAALVLVSFWGGGRDDLRLVILVSLGLALAMGARRSDRSVPRLSRRGVFEALVVVGVGVWMLWAPAPLHVGSDMPAHLGAIHDATRLDRVWTPDLSFGEAPAKPDPRFGVLHGLYAAMAHWSGTDPLTWVRALPALLSPVWVLAWAWLFRSWGSSRRVAVILALVFTLAGNGGRAFGLWSVAYPGNVALLVVVLALAAIGTSLGSQRRAWRPNSRWALGIGAAALTTRIHPFGWWIATVGVLQATLWVLLAPSLRGFGRRLAFSAGALFLGGVALLLPVLLLQSQTRGELHQMPLEIVEVGAGLFVANPLTLTHWGGAAALLAAPLMLLLGRDWWKDPARLLAGSFAMAVWTISLNPVVAPLAWKAVSYLVVRTSRMVPSAWWWWTLLMLVIAAWRGKHPPAWRRAVLLFLVVVCLAGFWQEGRTAARVLREAPAHGAPAVDPRVRAMVDALEVSQATVFLADPRLSYALRGLGGPRPWIYPLAHASPADVRLPERLGEYRHLLGPVKDVEAWSRRLRATGVSHVLVNLECEAFETHRDFGFEPSDARAKRLATRLRSWTPPVAEGEGWSLFAVPSEAAPPMPPNGSNPVPEPLSRDVPVRIRGSAMGVVEWRIVETDVERGSWISVRSSYRAVDFRRLSAHPDWEQIYLRLTREGESAVPPWASAFDKIYRKILVERSPRSDTRFGVAWVPFGGTWPPDEWAGGMVTEERRIRVPRHLRPGRYRIEVSFQEATWRPRFQLRDLLRDEDRYAGVPMGSIEVRAPRGKESWRP